LEHLERLCGGIIGLKFNKTSNKTLSFILSFASGLMMSIVCFDLIPESLNLAEFGTVISGIISKDLMIGGTILLTGLLCAYFASEGKRINYILGLINYLLMDMLLLKIT